MSAYPIYFKVKKYKIQFIKELQFCFPLGSPSDEQILAHWFFEIKTSFTNNNIMLKFDIVALMLDGHKASLNFSFTTYCILYA